MKKTKIQAILALSVLGSSLASAGTMGEEVGGYRPFVGVLGGYASQQVNLSGQQIFTSFFDQYIYNNLRGGNNSTGFVGAIAGLEQQVASAPFFVQFGLEYDYYGSVKIKGANYVGAQPSTFTPYTYQWNLQTQQILAVAKFLAAYNASLPYFSTIYPYATFGLGAAVNRSTDYSVFRQPAPSFNLTPVFADHSTTGFSYNIGFGAELPFTPNFRLGLGYRYSDFGAISLGSGKIVVNNLAAFPVSFTLGATKSYANEFVAQLTYLA